jgi:hypothetical protein
LPMASDFFMEKSPVIAISPNNETEHASISMVTIHSNFHIVPLELIS